MLDLVSKCLTNYRVNKEYVVPTIMLSEKTIMLVPERNRSDVSIYNYYTLITILYQAVQGGAQSKLATIARGSSCVDSWGSRNCCGGKRRKTS